MTTITPKTTAPATAGAPATDIDEEKAKAKAIVDHYLTLTLRKLQPELLNQVDPVTCLLHHQIL